MVSGEWCVARGERREMSIARCQVFLKPAAVCGHGSMGLGVRAAEQRSARRLWRRVSGGALRRPVPQSGALTAQLTPLTWRRGPLPTPLTDLPAELHSTTPLPSPTYRRNFTAPHSPLPSPGEEADLPHVRELGQPLQHGRRLVVLRFRGWLVVFQPESRRRAREAQ